METFSILLMNVNEFIIKQMTIPPKYIETPSIYVNNSKLILKQYSIMWYIYTDDSRLEQMDEHFIFWVPSRIFQIIRFNFLAEIFAFC